MLLRGMARRKLLRKLAREVLGEEEARRIWGRIEIVGDIAVIRRPFDYPLEPLRRLAAVLLERLPHVRSVWCATGSVTGTYRTREYVHLAGEPRSETLYREHGCLFKVDIRRVYLSPRLGYEHMRIARLVEPGETIVNMFAGAGLFSIVIAKHSEAGRIYSIDISPDAYRYMVENIRLNQVEDRVIPLLGDAARIIEERLRETADRVLMPLQGLSYDYLPQAVAALKGRGFIHAYDFTRAGPGEDPREKLVARFSSRLRELGVEASIKQSRVVRTVGPRRYQVVLDIMIKA